MPCQECPASLWWCVQGARMPACLVSMVVYVLCMWCCTRLSFSYCCCLVLLLLWNFCCSGSASLILLTLTFCECMHGGPGLGARECIAADRLAAHSRFCCCGGCVGVVGVCCRKNCPSVVPAEVSGALWLLLCLVYCVFVSWLVLVAAYFGAQKSRLRLVVPGIALPAAGATAYVEHLPGHLLLGTCCVCAAQCVGRMGRRACLCQLSIVTLPFVADDGLLSPAAAAAVRLLWASAYVGP